MPEAPKVYARRLDIRHGQVELAHGSGGRAMAQLIDELFARHLGNEYLAQGDDGALLPAPGAGRLVLATDSHVVSPLFFPGGDIGCLAVHGTINDVAVMGARPLWLSACFIVEEGFKLAELALIVQSMAAAATAAGVPVVAGDTKVVERGIPAITPGHRSRSRIADQAEWRVPPQETHTTCPNTCAGIPESSSESTKSTWSTKPSW